MKKTITLFVLLITIQLPSAFCQNSVQKSFAGIIIDSNGNSLVGANIAAYKNGIFVGGISTDKNGIFELSVKSFDSLKVSYLGFKTAQITFDDLLFDDLIMLSENSYEMETVVVKAYHQIRDWESFCCCMSVSVCEEHIKEYTISSKKRNWITYPNPSPGNVEISVDEDIKGYVEIFGSNGELLNILEINTIPISINLEKYPSGIYFLRYNSNGWVEDIGKVVKID